MNTKRSLILLIVVLVGLLVVAQRQVANMRQQLAFQNASIQSMGVRQATEDLSRGTATYIIRGRVNQAYLEAFDEYFKPYGIKCRGTGCKVFELDALFSDAYNAVIRRDLIAKHGKDLIAEFDGGWGKR